MKPNVFDILKPYKWLTLGLVLLGFATNGLNLVLPKIISKGVDAYVATNTILTTILWEFFFLSLGTFIFAYLQSIAQSYTSEKVARDLREKVVAKISEQDYMYIQKVTSSKLLTNLTSDIDNIKSFVGQAVVTIISSIFLIVGAAVLMILIDWKLALSVLATLPFIFITFALVFSKLKPTFKKSQEVIDWLNKIINGSVLGSAIIRVLNTKKIEEDKFREANTKAVEIGVKIINLFAVTFPVIGFVANLATIIILLLGGHFIINGTLSIGEFTAFVSYLGIIIFPVIMIGFLSSSISQAAASYARVYEVLGLVNTEAQGQLDVDIRGDIEVKNVSLSFDGKEILKNISFNIPHGTKVAILGPTAAGKTHIMYALIGLVNPNEGSVTYDGVKLDGYNSECIHRQIGLVFQDSIMFNMSLRENIAFSKTVKDVDIQKAIDTAELSDLVSSLPNGLDSMVMERGTSLSGGQKQRIMLARALALNPKVLLLDDFTARVDGATEEKILKNVKENYPDITLVSVTQKISSIKDFDQIILVMEGEILATGTHDELMKTSTEYVQIFNSQRSTNHYELQT